MKLLFKRYLKDNRLIFGLFSTVLMVITVWMINVYPSIKAIPQIQEVLDNLPKMFKTMIGAQILPITKFEGFMGMRYFNTTLVWVFSIFAMLMCSSMISADIGNQRMDIILSQPIKRHQIILARFSVFTLYMIGMAVVSYIGVMIGVAMIGIQTDPVLPIKLIIAMLPLPIAVGSMCLLISVMVDDPMRATSIALGIFVLMFFLNAAFALAQGLNYMRRFIIFYYYDATAMMKKYFDSGGEGDIMIYSNLFILLGIAVVFLTVSIWYFNRKEIYV